MENLSDIEIAQNKKLLHIREVAAKLGVDEDDLEMYGKYKAKLPLTLIDEDKIKNNNMISLNLNLSKNALKLAMLTALTYLLFSITSNYNTYTVNFSSEDTSTAAPDYYIK